MVFLGMKRERKGEMFGIFGYEDLISRGSEQRREREREREGKKERD